jgi:hypothetical protein
MTGLKLDPEGYFKFDLGGGIMRYREGDRLIAYPLAAMKKLLATSLGDIQKTLPYTIGLHMGEECGARVVEALGEDFLEGDTVPEDFLAHLNAVFALHGLGMASMESWGDLLLLRWTIEKDAGIHVTEFQEGVIAGVLSRVTGEAFEAASVDDDGEGMRFIAGNATMVDWTKLWLGEGCGLGEIVDRLHAGRHLEGEIQAE